MMPLPTLLMLVLVLLAAAVAAADPWPAHPTWEPTWKMARSTVMMPCNTSGWFDSRLAASYGIADFDWSNVRSMWTKGRPMDDGRRLAEQAAKVKAINPKTHVWVYRNLVKACVTALRVYCPFIFTRMQLPGCIAVWTLLRIPA